MISLEFWSNMPLQVFSQQQCSASVANLDANLELKDTSPFISRASPSFSMPEAWDLSPVSPKPFTLHEGKQDCTA